MTYYHTSVLLQEVLKYLDPKPGQNFVDATLGGGGYTSAILERIQPGGRLLAIDLDELAIRNYELRIKHQKFQNRIVLVHGNFKEIDKFVERQDFKNISGVVADLGLSSDLLENSGRGFSFQKNEPLDMRFDVASSSPDAKFILHNYSEKQLLQIFKTFGEEKYSLPIARSIARNRQARGLRFTGDLVEIIKQALPKPAKHKWADSARRIFQALRIAVNFELENLEVFLPKAFGLLAPGGRLAVVSFHSLEDRAVKQYFAALARACVCPPDFPQCLCGKNPQGKLLSKKPIVAQAREAADNPRSKSAKLRIIQKL